MLHPTALLSILHHFTFHRLFSILGKCLCSPQGCVPPVDQMNNTNWSCGGFPNPFHRADLVAPEHSNHAIVSYEHIDGYVPGRNFNVGDHVHVRRQEVCPQGGAPIVQVNGFYYCALFLVLESTTA